MAIIVGIIVFIAVIALINDSLAGRIGIFLLGTTILMLIGGIAFPVLWVISKILFVVFIFYLVLLLFIKIFND